MAYIKPFDTTGFSKKVARKIDSLRKSKKLIKPEVDAITNAIGAVRLLLTEIDASKITFPRSLQKELAKKVKEDVGEYIVQEHLVEQIRAELQGLLGDIIKIARHLEAIREGSEDALAKFERGKINSTNLLDFADAFSTELKQIEGHANAYNIKQIKKAILEIDDVVEKFRQLQSAEAKGYKILIDLKKVMGQVAEQTTAQWEATVKATGILSHFNPLKEALKELIAIIFRYHGQIPQDKTFWGKLRHIK